MTPTTRMLILSALSTARGYLASGRPRLADRVIADVHDLIEKKADERTAQDEAFGPACKPFQDAYRRACARRPA
jgi:hypothetical protein